MRLIAISLLALAFSSAPTLGQDFGEDNPDLWADEDYGLFETDNWAEDDFGTYDEDFAWETEDEEDFETWYENAENDWSEYDDAGDAGWFDI